MAVIGGTLLPASLLATPSTVFWAPSTPALQPYRVMHVTYDTYFARSAAYPTDIGLQMGVLPGKRLQAEAGFDLLYPSVSPAGPLAFPLVLNAKVGAPEDAWFPGSPGWSLGIFGAGFETDVTDYDIFHATLGRTFPHVGTLSAGAYYGLNSRLLRSSDGEEHRTGLLAGWLSPSIAMPRLEKLQLAWDVQTGENVLGATGGGLYLYFTPAVALLVGPVYFFDHDLQPGGVRWMWSVQLDADLDFSTSAGSKP